MQIYTINAGMIEELQTVKNVQELDAMFQKAKSTIVNGEKVVLVRHANGRTEKFDEITTEEELGTYKKTVYKYL